MNMKEQEMFENAMFDQWLHQKSQSILEKVQREPLSTEDMLVLSLKAQVNHFHHMDIEFREEFQKIDKRFSDMKTEAEKRFEQVDKRFVDIKTEVDKRFDRLNQLLMWGFGILIGLSLLPLIKEISAALLK